MKIIADGKGPRDSEGTSNWEKHSDCLRLAHLTHAQDSLEGLVKPACSDSAGLGWGPGICFPGQPSGSAGTADLQTAR